MFLQAVTIADFKAIKKARIELSEFNVIVGANGSGKSSILQAMHWMFQSGRNKKVEARSKSGDGATLSERDATYMPSPDYRNAGHAQEYGNRSGSPQLDIQVEALADDGSQVTAHMWIKSARNEGLSVHIPSSNIFVAALRDPKREFSAYIPGLAGVPLSEEKRSTAIVRRLAAAGDANTVLRNVLLLLKGVKDEKENGLTSVQNLVSKVMGDIVIETNFDDQTDSSIQARFQTGEMKQLDAKRFKPLELAGIGFLQVIQIFAYLVYFRPVILLVDEPDSHLHPSAQERLMSVLAIAARKFNTQVILTTHSPSVVRSLPPGARVIWMKNGEIQDKGDTDGRRMMGWGLLDKRLLLMTEDSEASMLKLLLSQWPGLERQIAVWPFNGSSTLPAPQIINGLVNLTGGSLKIVLHRDRDFQMPGEVTALTQPYSNSGHILWFTKFSDIEAYWTDVPKITAHFGISEPDAKALLDDAIAVCSEAESALKTRRKKRIDAINKIRAISNGELAQFGDAEVEEEAINGGRQYAVLGKDLAKAIRGQAQARKLKNVNTFGQSIPPSLPAIAADLEEVLLQALK